MLRTVAPALIAATCATACLEQAEDTHCETADKLFGACQDDTGGWDNGGGGGDGYVPQNATMSWSLQPTRTTGEGSTGWALAMGGTTTLTVDEKDTIDLDVALGAGPARLTLDLYTQDLFMYKVTTANIPGTTSLTISSDNFPPIQTQVDAKSVATVKIVPEQYVLATDYPAFTYWTGEVVLKLLAADGTRLVDETLVASAPYLGTNGWDRFRLPQIEDGGSVTVTAGSLITREVPFDMVGTIDRIEATVDGVPSAGHGVTVCVQAYNGDREVVAPFEFDAFFGQHESYVENCTGVSFTGGLTHATVTAHSLGLDHSVEVAIPAP